MDNQSEYTILDHIDNITVKGLVFQEPTNEYWVLTCLKQGMEFLYRQAKHCDNDVKQIVNPNGDIKYQGSGNLPEFQNIPKALLTCSFHWYAISACNYVRTIGAIAYKQASTIPKPKDYVEKVIPEVLTFRDKVAAHIVWASKNKKDNDAERLLSILPPLVFINNSFHVGAITSTMRKSGKISTAEAKPWSICNIHEELQKRYWP